MLCESASSVAFSSICLCASSSSFSSSSILVLYRSRSLPTFLLAASRSISRLSAFASAFSRLAISTSAVWHTIIWLGFVLQFSLIDALACVINKHYWEGYFLSTLIFIIFNGFVFLIITLSYYWCIRLCSLKNITHINLQCFSLIKAVLNVHAFYKF